MSTHPRKGRPPSPHPTLGLPISSPQSDALLVVNPEGTIRAVNRAALDLLGYAADEVVGQPIGRFLAERKKERKKERTGRGAAGRQAKSMLRLSPAQASVS